MCNMGCLIVTVRVRFLLAAAWMCSGRSLAEFGPKEQL